MNDRSRPKAAPETPAKKSTTTVPRGTDIQARRRVFCSADVYRRRRFARDFDELLADLYPPPPPVAPSTFGLDEDAPRRHARDLHGRGWSVDEITQVLDVKPVVK